MKLPFGHSAVRVARNGEGPERIAKDREEMEPLARPIHDNAIHSGRISSGLLLHLDQTAHVERDLPDNTYSDRQLAQVVVLWP